MPRFGRRKISAVADEEAVGEEAREVSTEGRESQGNEVAKGTGACATAQVTVTAEG